MNTEPMTDKRLAEIRDLDNAFRGLPSTRAWDDVALYDVVARSMSEMLAEVDRLRLFEQHAKDSLWATLKDGAQ